MIPYDSVIGYMKVFEEYWRHRKDYGYLARMAGVVDEVRIAEGDNVKPGELLMTIKAE